MKARPIPSLAWRRRVGLFLHRLAVIVAGH